MKARQMSCPIPRVPPVTSATFPVRSSCIRFPLCSPGSITARRAVVIESRCFHELGHLIRSSKTDHVRLRDDSLQEAREYGARADFHEARTLAAEPRCLLHAFYPTDRRRELVREEAPSPASVLHGLRGGIGDHGEGWIRELGALEGQLEVVPRGAHQRRVKRAAHLERDDAL